jgi:ribA/ribD-fused uncharacterized protein
MINKFRGPYAFLSNFYSCNIEFCGLTFGSVEAAYQSAKTDDFNLAQQFTRYDARTAKREGKKLKKRGRWDGMKLTIMHVLLLKKFENPELKQKLLDTGDEELIEGNEWNDTFWGVCNGIGENNLGKLLMKVREHYKNFN